MRNQGEMFYNICKKYPDMDFWWFVNAYLNSNVCARADRGHPVIANLFWEELIYEFMKEIDTYQVGEPNTGFSSKWFGEIYAYYHYVYHTSSKEMSIIFDKQYMLNLYPGAHNSDHSLAVKKMREYYMSRLETLRRT